VFDQSRFAIRRHIATADKNWVTVVTSGIGAGPCKLTREREITALRLVGQIKGVAIDRAQVSAGSNDALSDLD
jgi:hypothetical protein